MIEKKGFFRSSVGGFTKVLEATIKSLVKLISKSIKISIKSLYIGGKITSKSTYYTGKIVTNGGHVTLRIGGKTFLYTARKVFPRKSSESKSEYRKRMAKLGFKISIITAKIIIAEEGSIGFGDVVKAISKDIATDTVESLTKKGINIVSSKLNASNQAPHSKRIADSKKESVTIQKTKKNTNQIFPLQSIFDDDDKTPPIPHGLKIPGSPPPIPPGLKLP